MTIPHRVTQDLMLYRIPTDLEELMRILPGILKPSNFVAPSGLTSF